MRRPLPRSLVLLVPAVLAAVSCGGIRHSLDDLKRVHGATPRTLVHRFDVERYGWVAASVRWGMLSLFAGLGAGTLTQETLDDPSDFCVDRVGDLQDVDLDDIEETAEVLYWSGAILKGDPFPLSRLRAVRVVSEIVRSRQPELALLAVRPGEYLATTDLRLRRVEQLSALAGEGVLPEELKAEYLAAIEGLGGTPFPRASESRDIGRSLAILLQIERDPDVRRALFTGVSVLLTRGALQTLDQGFDDAHEQVRMTTARAFVRSLGAPGVLHAIQRTQGDSSAVVRGTVAQLSLVGLRAGGDPEPILASLYRATRDADANVSVCAMESLGRATGIGRRFDTDFWRLWWEDHQLATGAARGAGPAAAGTPK